MSVRKTIADELKAVGDALKAEGHALAGEVEKIWTKLTVGLPPAEHQALEDAHAVAGEVEHDAATVAREAGKHVEAAVGESAPAAAAHTPQQVSAVIAGETAVTDTAKGA
jgi:hypothetical protein